MSTVIIKKHLIFTFQAAAVVEDVGHVTMLVNNAGVVSGKPLLDLSPDELQYCLQVNTLSQVWVSLEVTSKIESIVQTVKIFYWCVTVKSLYFVGH